jgi:hypothetical protein
MNCGNERLVGFRCSLPPGIQEQSSTLLLGSDHDGLVKSLEYEGGKTLQIGD